jgi:hypothetical protein
LALRLTVVTYTEFTYGTAGLEEPIDHCQDLEPTSMSGATKKPAEAGQ